MADGMSKIVLFMSGQRNPQAYLLLLKIYRRKTGKQKSGIKALFRMKNIYKTGFKVLTTVDFDCLLLSGAILFLSEKMYDNQ